MNTDRIQLRRTIVVAGHACLDVIPAMTDLPRPGGLAEVGPATISCGGAVPNVGLVLAKLGVKVRLIARAGDDLFGREMQSILAACGADVRLRIMPGKSSSYSIVLAPEGVDRSFLHSAAVNHEFDPVVDVSDADLNDAAALHFGYPPIMRRIYADGGRGLASLFQRAITLGVMTSLDCSSPDMAGEAGKVDWSSWFARVLPHTSVFCPSLDEVQEMLRTDASASELSKQLVEQGAAVVVLKQGDRGLHLRVTDEVARLDTLHVDPAWLGQKVESPCFKSNFVSATGSGDATIAGLLVSMLLGKSPAEAARLACAVGGFSVEHATASGAIVPFEQVISRVNAGWTTLENP